MLSFNFMFHMNKTIMRLSSPGGKATVGMQIKIIYVLDTLELRMVNWRGMHFQHQCYQFWMFIIFWTLLSPIWESLVSVRTQATIICCIKKQAGSLFPLAVSVVELEMQGFSIWMQMISLDHDVCLGRDFPQESALCHDYCLSLDDLRPSCKHLFLWIVDLLCAIFPSSHIFP